MFEKLLFNYRILNKRLYTTYSKQSLFFSNSFIFDVSFQNLNDITSISLEIGHPWFLYYYYYHIRRLDFPFLSPNVHRGSKTDMQAAAGGAEYVGDEQGIMEGEQQYP